MVERSKCVFVIAVHEIADALLHPSLGRRVFRIITNESLAQNLIHSRSQNDPPSHEQVRTNIEQKVKIVYAIRLARYDQRIYGRIHEGPNCFERYITDSADVTTWRLDYGRCIFCGECSRVCGEGAISTTAEFELAVTERAAAVASLPVSLRASK